MFPVEELSIAAKYIKTTRQEAAAKEILSQRQLNNDKKEELLTSQFGKEVDSTSKNSHRILSLLGKDQTLQLLTDFTEIEAQNALTQSDTSRSSSQLHGSNSVIDAAVAVSGSSGHARSMNAPIVVAASLKMNTQTRIRRLAQVKKAFEEKIANKSAMLNQFLQLGGCSEEDGMLLTNKRGLVELVAEQAMAGNQISRMFHSHENQHDIVGYEIESEWRKFVPKDLKSFCGKQFPSIFRTLLSNTSKGLMADSIAVPLSSITTNNAGNRLLRQFFRLLWFHSFVLWFIIANGPAAVFKHDAAEKSFPCEIHSGGDFLPLSTQRGMNHQDDGEQISSSHSALPLPIKSKKRKLFDAAPLTNNIPQNSFVEVLDHNTYLLSLYDLSQFSADAFSNSVWLIIQEDFHESNVKKGQTFQSKKLHSDGYSVLGNFLNDDGSLGEQTHRIRYEAFLCDEHIIDCYNRDDGDEEEADDRVVVLCSSRTFD